MPEVRAQDGKNRKHEWAAFEEVPALRGQGGGDGVRAGDSVQGLGVVRDGLWREEIGRGRFGKRGEAGGGIERGGERCQGFRRKGIGGKGFWEREEDGEGGEEKVAGPGRLPSEIVVEWS